MLTRLRQLALHPSLIPENYLESLRASDKEGPVAAIRITQDDKIRLQGLLAQAIEDNEECPICFCILTDPRITTCAHCFCLTWCVILCLTSTLLKLILFHVLA
jgi:SWI/SNF-related matrix-associated actin-dependent regulator of chromatin subfamily A3